MRRQRTAVVTLDSIMESAYILQKKAILLLSLRQPKLATVLLHRAWYWVRRARRNSPTTRHARILGKLIKVADNAINKG